MNGLAEPQFIPTAKQVVDELRAFATGKGLLRPADAARIGEAYAAACREVNRRLGRCDELLRKGLRAEAVQVAEEEPPLLELVARLHFDKLKEWEDLATAHGYAPPPALHLDTAEALNRAYGELQSLGDLLKQQHRLALVRAPLTQRLAVLRQLAAADPANPAWGQDLAIFEAARQRELRDEVAAAFARKDEAAGNVLLRELVETPWRSPPPAEFVQPAAKRHLDKLSRQLDDASAANDIAALRVQLPEWERVAHLAGVRPGDPACAFAEAAHAVVAKAERRAAKEGEFQAALTELDDGLRRGAPADELSDLYDNAVRYRRPIPPELDKAYHKRMEALVEKRKGREAKIVLAVFAAGAFIVALIVAAVQFL